MKKVKIYPWTPEMIHALSGGDPVIEEQMKDWNKGMARFEEYKEHVEERQKIENKMSTNKYCS